MLRRVFTSVVQRTISNARHYSAAYDGDAKTTVTILHRENPLLLVVKSYTDYGFRLSNEMFVVGPMLLLPGTVLHWNVGKPEDIKPESLILFSKLAPKPDLVVIGYGNRGASKISPELRKFSLENKISMEFLPTTDAIATFNYLIGDGRLVAGCFLPLMNARQDTEQYSRLEEKRRKLLLDS